MSLAGLLNQSCTITTRTDAGTKDRYGNPDLTEATTATVCYCEQRTRAEASDGLGEVQQEDWLVMLPAGTTVNGHDKITVGSLVLEVVGPPWPVRNPRTQSTSHVELTARRAA
ncbi:MAG TPA: hypothetical protein PKB00_12285 [Microthrixaceae bacterium]|nr:hypothetical protein [Microthrixaceae bacterium]HNH38629.1 hypothetical protein [Microthrixaceae bacterium]